MPIVLPEPSLKPNKENPKGYFCNYFKLPEFTENCEWMGTLYELKLSEFEKRFVCRTCYYKAFPEISQKKEKFESLTWEDRLKILKSERQEKESKPVILTKPVLKLDTAKPIKLPEPVAILKKETNAILSLEKEGSKEMAYQKGYTEEQEQFLRKNFHPDRGFKELAILFNQYFGTDKNRHQIGNKCQYLGLKKPKGKKAKPLKNIEKLPEKPQNQEKVIMEVKTLTAPFTVTLPSGEIKEPEIISQDPNTNIISHLKSAWEDFNSSQNRYTPNQILEFRLALFQAEKIIFGKDESLLQKAFFQV